MFAWLFGDTHKTTSEYYQSHWHPGGDPDGNCARVQRFGLAGDGGKQVCVSDLDAAPANVLVSIGSNGEFSFEAAMLAAYPKLDVHIYDGTYLPPNLDDGSGAKRGATAVPPGMTYHHFNAHVGMHLPYLQKRERAILKIDCEGCEYTMVPWLVSKHAFDQILIETHVKSGVAQARGLHAFMSMLNVTHSVYSSEVNVRYAPCCTEFSLRRRR